jgi:hypothetical protein
MLRGEVTDPFNLWAPSASTFFHRVFMAQPQVNPHPLFESPFLFALLYPLWQLGPLAVTLVLISPRRADPKSADPGRADSPETLASDRRSLSSCPDRMNINNCQLPNARFQFDRPWIKYSAVMCTLRVCVSYGLS